MIPVGELQSVCDCASNCLIKTLRIRTCNISSEVWTRDSKATTENERINGQQQSATRSMIEHVDRYPEDNKLVCGCRWAYSIFGFRWHAHQKWLTPHHHHALPGRAWSDSWLFRNHAKFQFKYNFQMSFQENHPNLSMRLHRDIAMAGDRHFRVQMRGSPELHSIGFTAQICVFCRIFNHLTVENSRQTRPLFSNFACQYRFVYFCA